MAVRFRYCPYQLLFKHPFGTAHGMRTGTDAVLVRIESEGVAGFGEATLPPYLEETTEAVIQRLKAFAARGPRDLGGVMTALSDPAWGAAPGFRNAVHTAAIDALNKISKKTVKQVFMIRDRYGPIALMTLGISAQETIALKISELPLTDGLKVKVDRTTTVHYIEHIRSLTDRKLFIDANQGLERPEQALELLAAAGQGVLGLEQPFRTDAWEVQTDLRRRTPVTVYGDESIRTVADLERAQGAFSGVNIKLMKCGGLDNAVAIAERARELGMRVMLGSMSESSLGCTAMAHLAGLADLVDLDGPWLISNDPFRGIGLADGRLRIPDGPGIGAVPVLDLPFEPICA